MKKMFTRITLLILLAATNVFAANPAIDYSKVDPSTYKPGTVLVKVKAEFSQLCSMNSINIPAVNKVLQSFAVISLDRKFPHAKVPGNELNKAGRKPVNLTLIYKIDFSMLVKIPAVIKMLNATNVFSAVEPSYIQKMDFTPNDPDLSSQYHISKINALLAWDVWTGDTNTVIGIVDSGTDWDHPDLAANVKNNYADPIDGIDNDNDGFVDNFRGWDVSENDNDPVVVSSTHGSHVSGCADAVTNNATGIAAPGYNCKFLPVKCALDASTTSIDNGYDGIVYAADHGVNIINCSWGRAGLPSSIEEDVLDYALYDKDVLVVCAAGNDGLEENHYPSAYGSALAVAATNNTDSKSNFSNFGQQIDVCAPGSNIFSTIFDDSYAQESGTSMASPIAAGCAAMIKSKFPALDARQVGEQLRSTCDNIYSSSGNGGYLGKLGKGRVNLFKAVSDSISPGVVLKSHIETDGNDNAFVPGDTLNIVALFENLLRPTTNLTCSLVTNTSVVQILQSNYNAGVINTMDTASNFSAAYRVYITPSAPLNTEVAFRILLTDGTWNDQFIFKVTVNVDYVNIEVNDIGTSLSSRGLVGYNQAGKLQGLGFTYEGSESILYDMSLMVGGTGTQVSDDARALAGVTDDDFLAVQNVRAMEPGTVSDYDVNGQFNDLGSTSVSPVNVLISQHAYAWVNAPDNKYVMVQYSIKNTGASAIADFHAGLFADWDVMDYDKNKCETDQARRMGYVYSTEAGGLYGGIKLLSHTGAFNHFAADNDSANGGINLGDGFENTEKFTALSVPNATSGNHTPDGNDVSSCVATGTGDLQPGDSVTVAFALIGGDNLASIQASADAAQQKYDGIFSGIEIIGNAKKTQLNNAYPNPAGSEVRIDFSIDNSDNCRLEILNTAGKVVKTILNEKLTSGNYTSLTDVSNLASGNYFYRLTSGSFNSTLPLTIIRK